MAESNSSRAMSAAFLFVVAAGVAFLIWWGWHERRQSARRTEVRERLKMIGLALHEYHDEWKTLPPAYVLGKDGKPWHSWRVLILPKLGLKHVYDRYRFDEPWDGPNNRKLLAETPEPFRWAWPSAAGDTHFQVAVGSQTAWPGPHSTHFGMIKDGLSNTILALETNDGIPWTAPHDLLFVKYIAADSTLRKHPPGRDSVNAAWGDGSVRVIDAEGKRGHVYAYLTMRSGQPYGSFKDGKFIPVDLPEERGALSVTPLAIPRIDLKNTDVWPVRNQPLVPVRNSLWCATMQLSWQRHDAVTAQTGFPAVQLAGRTPLAFALAKERFPEAALDPNSYVAMVGEASQVERDFPAALATRFPGAVVALTPIDEEDRAQGPPCYRNVSYLSKRLPFATPFGQQGSMAFQHAGGTATVESFGCQPMASEVVRKQVKVWADNGKGEYVLSLATDGVRKDRVWLATLPAGATLAATWKELQRRIDKPLEDHFGELYESDTLLVPTLAFEAVRPYPELVVPRERAPADARRFADVQQTLRFALDYKGALLESFDELVDVPTANGHAPPPPPRRFAFDRPFLLALQESGAAEPYFLAWVATPELLVPVKP